MFCTQVTYTFKLVKREMRNTSRNTFAYIGKYNFVSQAKERNFAISI